MPNIGPAEIIIVLVIALVILGPKKLPEAGRSVGRSLREFRSGMKDSPEIEETVAAAPAPVATATATAAPAEPRA